MALVLTESPYLDAEQIEIIKQGRVRAVFTNDKSSVEVLRNESGKIVHYLPHSYDRRRHHHKDAVLSRFESDIFFHGTWWPERQRLIEPLGRWARWHGYKAHIVGVDAKKKRGMISNADMIRYYSGTKIALNHHRTVIGIDGNGQERHVSAAYSLGPRAFEIAACGTFQLCDDTRPELHEVFGDTVATYHDGDDLRGLISYYLTHEDERQDMARAALERVTPCSFESRSRDILMPAIHNIL
jgi:spore maturation protein CgeB